MTCAGFAVPSCPDDSSTWYLSDDCSLPIHTTAFFAGLTVTLVCLLVTVGAVTAYAVMTQRKQRR